MKKVIAIVGPTACGKTQLAIELAQALNTEIINVDSRQIYIDFNIGTAKPSPLQLAMIPHHLVSFVSPYQHFTAQDFSNAAEAILQNSSKPMILAGGTGLYFHAIAYKLDTLPEIPSSIRDEIQHNFQRYGIRYLLEELQLKDPQVLKRIDVQNPRRLSRALEVYLASGKSILEFWRAEPPQPQYDILWIGIDLGWEILERNIRQRMEVMLKQGWIEETQTLIEKYPRPCRAFESIGYQEIISYLQGLCTFQEMQERIYIQTRQYAKRQLTWFRKNPNIQWFTQIEKMKILKRIENFI